MAKTPVEAIDHGELAQAKLQIETSVRQAARAFSDEVDTGSSQKNATTPMNLEHDPILCDRVML